MSEEIFYTWEELAAAYRKLKADHIELRKLVDGMADAIENHVHSLDGMWAVSGKPLKRPSPTPLPTPGPTSGQRQAPAAPAEGRQ